MAHAVAPVDPDGWPRRYTMVLLCACATFICYIDRVNISVAVIPMAEQFGWTDSQRGLVLSSFFVGYLVTQIVGGWLAARWGGKVVLGFGVLWWSLFTLLTPLSALTSFPALIAARVAMGLGEGVAFPATYNLLGRWVPLAERSRAAALNLSAVYLGTLFAVIVTPFVIVAWGWPAVFYLFGLAGFAWFAIWWPLAANRPAEPVDPQLAVTEGQAPDTAIPWRRILSSISIWAIFVAHFCNNWGLYVLMSWLPSYFASALGVDLKSVWIYVAPPYIAGFLGGNLAGWIADRMIAAGHSVTSTRKALQTVGFLGPALMLGVLANTGDAVQAVLLLTIATGLASFTLAAAGCNHLDVSPTHAGILFGLSNTGATVPGIIGVALTGFLVEMTGGYAAAFYVTAGVYLFGLAFYLAFATGRRVL